MFKIRDVVDASYKPNPSDTFEVKKSLNQLGYYKPPLGEFTKFTETGMYDGIKKFQQDNNLSVDGRINPDGETIKKMNELLERKKINVAQNNLYSQKSQVPSEWGKGTQSKLDKYMDNDSSYPGRVHSGIIAPFKDLSRNKAEMERLGLKGSDKFFHCKGNYEAAKRGNYGRVVAKTMNVGREVIGLFQYGLQDSVDDWSANERGWSGVRKGQTLKEACPRNPRDYMK